MRKEPRSPGGLKLYESNNKQRKERWLDEKFSNVTGESVSQSYILEEMGPKNGSALVFSH